MLQRRQAIAGMAIFQLMILVAWVYSDDSAWIALAILLLGFVFLSRWSRYRVRFVVTSQPAPASQPRVPGWRARVAGRPSPSLRCLTYQGIALLLLFVLPLSFVVSMFFWPLGALPEWVGAFQHIAAAGIIGWAGGAIVGARR